MHTAITYRIKPDRIAEWRDLRRQVVDIFKKAGLEHTQLVYASLTGPFEYVIVRQYAKWEDLAAASQQSPKLKDSAAQLASLNSRMFACVESMSRDLGRVSDVSYGMSEEPAPMVRVLRTTLKPGGAGEYMNLVKSEVVPAYQKAGIKTFVQITPSFGSGAVISVIPMSYKDLDGGNPLVKALGSERSAALLKKLDAHIVRRDADLFAYNAGLSYRPGAAAATPGTR